MRVPGRFGHGRGCSLHRCAQRSTRKPASRLTERILRHCQAGAPRRAGWIECGVSPSDATPTKPVPASALGDFVHGIAVRSWVLARHQTGDAAVADRLLAAAVARFVQSGATQPLSQWPLGWWSALLEQRGMLLPAEPGATDLLRRLPAGPRAALLLRLVAGLDLVHAAQALGVAQSAYEAALAQALSAPGMDDARVEALRALLHDEVHAIPMEHKQAVLAHADEAMPRHAVLAAPSVVRTAPASPVAGAAKGHGPGKRDTTQARWWALAARAEGRWRHAPWMVAGALLLALALAWLWPGPPAMPPGRSEALPAEPVAAAPALGPAQVVTHPDYLQLARPEDERLARDLGFLSWLAASTEPATAGPGGEPADANAPIPDDARALLAPVAATWTSLDGPSRRRLLAQAADWNRRDAAARAALLRSLQAWDRLPAPERARRRETLVAWQELEPGERLRVAAAATHFAARSIAEQAALRLQFAALPDDTQQLWRLGPALGPDLGAIAPLFAFLPARERPALLSVLRTLDAGARRDLSELAPRLSEVERAQLRRDLAATPPAQRAALIRARLAR